MHRGNPGLNHRFSLPFGVPSTGQPRVRLGTFVIAFDAEVKGEVSRDGILIQYNRGGTTIQVVDLDSEEVFTCKVEGVATKQDDELSERCLASVRQARRRNYLPEQ